MKIKKELCGSAATSDVWTGLNDLTEPGMYIWSDEHAVTFTYWAPGEPNNHDGFNEDCVEMLHTVGNKKTSPFHLCRQSVSADCEYFLFLFQNGRWNDVSCTELNTYICKTAKAHYPLPSVKPTQYGCPQVR